MSTYAPYQGILFPDRAESLGSFEEYKVFLDHWNPLSNELRTFYEGMALRGETRCLAVFGPQGGGKTLFAKRLVSDFASARAEIVKGTVALEENNLWHRVTKGSGMAVDLVEKATLNTEIFHIEDDKDWVAKTISWKRQHPTRHCIIIADNAERDYFMQSLLGLSDAEFLTLGATESAARAAAQRFVALARGELRGCLVLLLTNSEMFLLSFDEFVEAQHSGLLKISAIPAPSSRDKEIVVRVNTNRLNEISYWFCLDKAGQYEKKNVYKALSGASTFPDSFAAVDRAIVSADASRVGRPAKKSVVSLIVLHGDDQVEPELLNALGIPDSHGFKCEWLAIETYKEGWATTVLPKVREAKLLESEWQLRVVALGQPFVRALLSRENDARIACESLLQKLKIIHGPGTHDITRREYSVELMEMASKWGIWEDADILAFWQKNQARSTEYEDRLRVILPGYNTGGGGFLSYRPDYIVSPYRPCSILEATSEDSSAINAAIRRDAHVYEFVAIKTPSASNIQNYLKSKLPNYVEIVQEQ